MLVIMSLIALGYITTAQANALSFGLTATLLTTVVNLIVNESRDSRIMEESEGHGPERRRTQVVAPTERHAKAQGNAWVGPLPVKDLAGRTCR